MWITTLLEKLLLLMKRITSTHKKKLITAAILFLGLSVAKKKLKTHHIISTVMFFIKFWSNVLNMLPMPKFREYRENLSTFKYQKQQPIAQIPELMKLNKILAKVKNKQEGSLNQLKFSIISGIVLSFVLYNTKSFYNLVYNKYCLDFSELSAQQNFQNAIDKLKANFVKNLQNIKNMVETTLHKIINGIDLSEVFDIVRLQKVFRQLVDKIFQETQNIANKVRNTFFMQKNTKQYEIAHNYFTSTLQYMQQQKPNPLVKTFSVLFKPITVVWKGFSKAISIPQDQISQQRYFCNEFMYILPLKKYRNQEQWPNKQSSNLNSLVIQQMSDFLSSLNFCTFLRTRAQHYMHIFLNRMNIFFNKKTVQGKKKLLDLLPIFYKVIKEQIIDANRRNQLYDRELATAFKQTKCKLTTTKNIADIKLRNKILIEFYRQNQLGYLQRDIQIKYFNQRQNIIIRPKKKNKQQYEENNQVHELLDNYDKVNDENKPKQYMDLIKRTLGQ